MYSKHIGLHLIEVILNIINLRNDPIKFIREYVLQILFILFLTNTKGLINREPPEIFLINLIIF